MFLKVFVSNLPDVILDKDYFVLFASLHFSKVPRLNT